jgi:hypothetical protein
MNFIQEWYKWREQRKSGLINLRILRDALYNTLKDPIYTAGERWSLENALRSINIIIDPWTWENHRYASWRFYGHHEKK